MKSLLDNARISLPLAIVAIGGGAFWLSSLFVQVRADSAKIDQIQEKQDRYSEQMQTIREDIAVIKTILQRKTR